MKKLIISVIITEMLLALINPVHAFAINSGKVNELYIEKSILTEDVLIDGTLILPSAMVITVNITNNIGFDNSTTMLKLGDAFDVIEGPNGKPIIANGEIFDDSIVCSVENNNILTVVSASDDVKCNDGSLFSFYVNVDDNSNDRTINILTIPEVNADIQKSNLRSGYYAIGDVNHDGVIDGRDAAKILNVINNTAYYCYEHRLPIDFVQSHIDILFPGIPSALIVDAFITTTYDENGNPTINAYIISSEDAYDILSYYSYVMAGSLVNYNGRVGTNIYII